MEKISVEFTEEQLKSIAFECSGSKDIQKIIQIALRQTICTCKKCQAIRDEYFPDEVVKEDTGRVFSNLDEFQRDLNRRMMVLERDHRKLSDVVTIITDVVTQTFVPMRHVYDMLRSISDKNRRWNLSTDLSALDTGLVYLLDRLRDLNK